MEYLTNAIFVASRDPRINALQDLKTADGRADTGARLAAAHQLVAAGLTLSAGIDIDGEDPFLYMRDLASLGFTWYSALFQQELPTNQILDYQDASKAWPGSIIISLNAADYPAFAPPPPPPLPESPIGGQTGVSGVYAIDARAFFKNGVPQYAEGASAAPFTAPDGEAAYAHFGFSAIMSGWSWETAAAKAARGGK